MFGGSLTVFGGYLTAFSGYGCVWCCMTVFGRFVAVLSWCMTGGRLLPRLI